MFRPNRTIISAVLQSVTVLLFSNIVSATFLPDGNDLLSMEAEHFETKTPGSSHTWEDEVNPTIGFAGDGTMEAQPELSTNIKTNYAANSPRLDFPVQINTAGTYTVWIRGLGPGGGANSVHVGLNGAEVPSAASIGFAANSGYVWSDGADTLTISTTGVHTINVWMREDSTIFDKIELSLDPPAVYTPTGTGSPESMQSGIPTVATPTIAPNGGNFVDMVSVTLDTTTAGADIYYTTDGSDPTMGSNLYSMPFVLSTLGMTTVKAIGILSGFNDSSIASAVFTITSSGGGGAFLQQSGVVSMEAENAHNNISRSGRTWTPDTAFAGWTGLSAMQATPDTGLKITTNIETTSPQLDYQINFSTSGTQTVWIRGHGPKGGSDSVHLGLNGSVTTTGISVPRSGWGWVSRTINIPSTGIHTLNIWMREDGTRIDKIVINQGAVVSGDGPDESPQGGGGNLPPTAMDDNFTVIQDSMNNVLDVLMNDTDPNFDPLLIDAATTDATSAQGGTVAINGTQDRIIYTPPPSHNGADSFTYGIHDGNGGNDTAMVNITVDPPGGNTPPTAVDDDVTVIQDSINNVFDVLINDTDPDPDTLSIIAAVNPSTAGGTVVINSTQDRIRYTPPTSFNGPDSFTYDISDGNGGNDTGTVNITVDPPGSGGGGGAFLQQSGVVSMEAENAHANISRSGHTWTVDTSFAGWTGASALQATPDTGLKITTNIETTSPQLDYQINFSTSGIQTVWIRSYGSKGGSDSVHLGLNGVVTTTGISVPRSGWGWVSKTINIPSTGVHTLNIWMREDGTRIDKIVINQGAVVSGNGPDESESEGCQSTPFVTLDSPEALHIQSSTDLTVQATACLDPVEHVNWRVRFVLLDDSVPPVELQSQIVDTEPFAWTFSGIAKGEYTVQAQLLDATSNTPQPGSNAEDEVQQVGIGDYIIAMGDSITASVGDDDPTDDTCSDGRVTGGGYPPILCTELNNRDLSTGTPFPHFIANEGVPGDTSADGVAIIASVLTNHPEAQQVILWFGMNDARVSNPTPSGLGLDPGDAGYSGSYKHNMQQMIEAIQDPPNYNREVVLAKINIALGDCANTAMCPPYPTPPGPENGERSNNIKVLNMVIDEIRTEMNSDANPSNDINVIPPDFFNIFKNILIGSPGQYFDNIHPSGQGYDTSVKTTGGWVDALCPSCIP